MKITRRTLLLIGGGVLALIVIIGGGAVALQAQDGGEGQESKYREAALATGDLRETVSATGPVDARQRSDMAFLLSGPVGPIPISEGQRVHKGDLLMSLDTTDYQFDLASAQLALEAQQIAYNQLVQPPDKFDLAAARAAVARSSAQLAQVREAPNEDRVRLAQQNLELQRNNLHTVQKARDGVSFLLKNPRFNRGQVDSDDLHDINLDVAASELAVRIAEQELIDAQQGLAPHDVASAQAALAQSLSTLNRLLEGPTESDLALARIQIEQSELSVQAARKSLDNATLTAPFDGVIGEVNYVEGEQASPGRTALVLLDDTSFHVDILIDEVDIARVKEGQVAYIRLDAYPDRQLTGHVASLAPDSITVNGVVSYQVRVEVNPADVEIHDGMTATIDIVVAELKSVLLVPNWAVRFDRKTGQAFVNIRQPDNTIQEVRIELGERGQDFSEVRGGIKAGDVVVVSLESAPLLNGGQ
jgi:HlyD family secretion protein